MEVIHAVHLAYLIGHGDHDSLIMVDGCNIMDIIVSPTCYYIIMVLKGAGNQTLNTEWPNTLYDIDMSMQ